MTPIAKCKCGRTFTRGELAALVRINTFVPGLGVDTRKLCTCGLTLVVPEVKMTPVKSELKAGPTVSFDEIKNAYEEALKEE